MFFGVGVAKSRGRGCSKEPVVGVRGERKCHVAFWSRARAAWSIFNPHPIRFGAGIYSLFSFMFLLSSLFL